MQSKDEPDQDRQDQTLVNQSCPKCGQVAKQCHCATTWPVGNLSASTGNPAEDSRQVLDPLIGSLFDGRYRVQELIGRGGMGAVYKAEHIGIGKLVAVKLLDITVSSDATAVMRFSQEAKAAGGLSHANLVGVSDYGFTSSGVPYLVMDYLKGQGLDQVLLNEQRLESLRAVDIFIQIADGLAHAHAKGVVHRDLKPSNIILGQDERGREIARVVDFGIAKVASRTEQALTKAGDIFGSPPYMSPEQCLGQTLDQRSDIYSLGCVMYETLTGKMVFRGSTVLQTFFKHAEEAALPLHLRCAEAQILPELDALVLKCLAKNPDERYQSMLELSQDLMTIRKNLAQPQGKAVGESRRFKVIALGCSVVVVLLAVATGLSRLLPATPAAKSVVAASTPVLPNITAEKPELEWSNLDALAQLAVDAGDYGKAQSLYDRSNKVAQSIGPGYKLASLEGISDLWELTGKDNKGFKAEIDRLAKESIDVESLIKALNDARDKSEASALISQSVRLGALLNRSGRSSDCQKLLKTALAVGKNYLPPDDPTNTRCLLELAESYGSSAENQSSPHELEYLLKAHTTVVGHPDSELLDRCVSSIGRYYLDNGSPALALPFLKQAQTLETKLFGITSKQVAVSCFRLAQCYEQLKRKNLAIQSGREALTIMRSLKAEELDGDSLMLLAELERSIKQNEQAVGHCRRSLSEFERGPAKNYPAIAKLCDSLKDFLAPASPERTALLRREMAILRRIDMLTPGAECRINRFICLNYFARNHFGEARTIMRRSVAILSQQPPDSPLRRAEIKCALWLATACDNLGEMTEAEKNTLVFKSWVLQDFGPNSYLNAEADGLLGSIYLKTNRIAEGQQLMQKALALAQRCMPSNDEQVEYQQFKNNLARQLAASIKGK